MFTIAHSRDRETVRYKRGNELPTADLENLHRDGVPPSVYSIEGPDDLRPVPSRALVLIHQEITGSDMPHFPTRAVAHRRTFADLETLE